MSERTTGRGRAEDGPIPDRYPLVETSEADYDTRTRRNVEDSDGTLILNLGKLESGTALTAKLAQQIGKPHLVVALEDGIEQAAFQAWLATYASSWHGMPRSAVG